MMKITSTELAKICGVSRATVDRVFHNRGHVNDETRELVLQTAERLGYQPNYIAQCLVTGRTRTIGLVIPSLNNAFFSTLVNAVAREAQNRQHIALVTLYEDDPQLERECLLSLAERQVDGFLLFSTSKGNDIAGLLHQRNIPAVAMLNRVEGLPCVRIDYRRAMADAAAYAIGCGYRHLVFLCPPLEQEPSRNIDALRERLEGFLQITGQYSDIRRDILDTADYLQRLDALPLHPDGRTAVLCSSDVFALEVQRHWRLRGIRTPKDAGLMGFDGIDPLRYAEPTLATVRIPIAQLGEVAVQELLDQIENGCMKEALLPYEIQSGQSMMNHGG